MKKVHRRAWSLVLALVIAMTLLPVSGLAFSWWGEPREESYNAYYYVLLPSFTQGDVSRDPADFNFVGMGSVTDLGPPNGQSKNQTIPINKTNIKYMTVPNKDVTQTFYNGATKITVPTYPSFEYKGNMYVYKHSSAAASSQYTYDIIWYRYSSSTGYNIGSDDDSFSHYPPEYDGYTWHVDGYVTLSDKASVTYKVKFPGSDVFDNVDEDGERANNAYVVYVDKNPGVRFSEITAAPQMKQSIEEQNPSGPTVTYTFAGWYYDEECTRPVPPDYVISNDVVVYGKYDTESVSGSSYLDIEVYLDGKEIFLSDNESDPGYWRKYVTSVGNVSSTANVEVKGVENGLLRCTFDYTNFDAADIAFVPGDGYVLQGVYGTFIYGMNGWNSPVIYDARWVLDNVKGETTLTVYLNTPYRLEYHVPAPASAPEDDNIYIACKKLDNFSPPVFPGLTPDSPIEDRNKGKEGGWVRNALQTTAALKDVPAGYTGWYTTADGDAKHESSYTGESIEQAAGEDNVIHCYARPGEYTLSYSWTGLPTDAGVQPPQSASYSYGAPVTIDDTYKHGTTKKVGHDTYAFSGWTLNPALGTGGTMPASDVAASGVWTKTVSDPQYEVTYEVTGEAPGVHSAVPATEKHYEGDNVKVAAGLTTSENEKDGVSGTWAFNGWSTADVLVSGGEFAMPAGSVKFTGSWTFTPNTHSITINYVGKDGSALQESYSVTKDDGSSYSFTFGDDEIPRVIEADGKQYVFNCFINGGDALSGTLKDDVAISAEYLPDSDMDGTPDEYEATVTYKVVNGFWSDNTNADKKEEFDLKKFDESSLTWVEAEPKLGSTIPTGMKPDSSHLDAGSWDEDITPDTPVIGGEVYTYTFDTAIAPALTVEKTVFSVGGVEVADQSAVPAAVLGGVIEYRLLIKNSGNTELTNVVVSDSLWAKGMEISVGGKTLVLEGGSYTIGSLAPGSSVSISYAHTVTGDEVQAGAVPNRASATAYGGVSGVDTAFVPVNGSIEITPADITIYMGGDEGYEAVVGDGGTVSPSNSMPAPLFYVDPPASLGADVVNITLKGNDRRVWEFRLAGYDKFGSALYSIESTGFTGQDPVRVSYTGADGKLHVNDSFDPGKIDELFAKYDIDIYRGGAQSVWAEYDGSNYGVATGTGKLVVRAVEDSENSRNPVISVVAEVTRPVVSGSAAVSAPYGTTYTLNDTTVPVKAEGVGLLFDGIIDKDVNRTEVLLSTIEAQFNVSINPHRYQAQYLDLVDANNGNAWVKASGPVTVYWGYPEGTGQNTNFTLYHFTDLHRDGISSGFDVVDISGSKIELVKLRKTANGIAFEVEPGGFSPFVLVWENIVIPDIPVTPAEPVYEPNWLNTTDHFGYIIGYEDGTIRPDASITRAEVATIFFRLLTDEARDKFWTETNSYSDVAETAWYNNAVSTLSRMGILGGYEDGTFRPNASITRAEFAKIAVSFFEYEDISAENIFTDVAAGSWYENFVAVAAKLGLIEGYAGNVYRPNESITRAEACTIINRTLGRAPDADHLLPESQMNTWPDNRPGTWYYAQLQEATNSHEYKWSGDIEHWTAKLPERDWDALQR